MELVFATHNKNKLIEIKALLPHHITLLSLDDIGCFEDIPETSDNIEGNAILKVEHVKTRYKYDCFADDTGLLVDALNGEPGVFSARYAGEEKNDKKNVQKVLKKLRGEQNRKARFKTAIALSIKSRQHLFTGICEGQIIEEPRGDKGFGYDSIFMPEGKKQSFAEMELSEKSTLSHRSKAFRNLISYLAE